MLERLLAGGLPPQDSSHFQRLRGALPDLEGGETPVGVFSAVARGELSAAGEDPVTPAPDADSGQGGVQGGQGGSQAGDGPGATPTKVAPDAGTMAAGVYAKHDKKVGTLSQKMTAAQRTDLAAFEANWKKNKARYEAVAAKAGVPAPLVAALHWRESTGDFRTYLHQGDPLGKPAVHVPKDIPVFHVWEDAAVHALTMSDKKQVRDDLNMTQDTRDSASMATYAEFYNGLGYHNKGRNSPYVYSGTDAYDKGKYTSDGHYSKNTRDQQLGVMALVDSIGGMDSSIKKTAVSGATGWDSIAAGRSLRRGARGPLVKELQARLAAAGFPCGDDSSFGPTVEKAVKAFQEANKLDPDGIVGKDVATRLGPVPAKTDGAAGGGAAPGGDGKKG